MLTTQTISELAQDYHNDRQAFEVTLQGLNQRAENLKSTNKFTCIDGVWHPQDF